MLKVIITKIENIRRTQVVKYEVNIPRNIVNIDKYLNECVEDDNLDLGEVISEETLEGEILENDISKIEVFDGKNSVKVHKY